MDSLASEIFVRSASEFQKACVQTSRSRDTFRMICELYKSILDGNAARKFCIDGHCTTIFMVEILFGDFEWGATPKTFYIKEEAEEEAEALKVRYPFLSGCRVITRNIEDEEKEINTISTSSKVNRWRKSRLQKRPRDLFTKWKPSLKQDRR